VNAQSGNRRLTVMVFTGIATFAFLALVIFSPLALRELTGVFNLNWSDLSNAGQTYGAVSALITALALGGVVISLFYQAKDVSTARSQAIRTSHFELLRIELDDEDCMWASGAPWGMTAPANYRELRLVVYVHMWVSFWESQFLIGEMPGEMARSAAIELFSGRAGREYWRARGQQRLSSVNGRRLAFARIIDGAYRDAIRNPAVTPPETAAGPSAAEAAKPNYSKAAMPYIVAVAAGLVTGKLARSWADRSSIAAWTDLP
jgi:hypothetical protein